MIIFKILYEYYEKKCLQSATTCVINNNLIVILRLDLWAQFQCNLILIYYRESSELCRQLTLLAKIFIDNFYLIKLVYYVTQSNHY